MIRQFCKSEIMLKIVQQVIEYALTPNKQIVHICNQDLFQTLIPSLKIYIVHTSEVYTLLIS